MAGAWPKERRPAIPKPEIVGGFPGNPGWLLGDAVPAQIWHCNPPQLRVDSPGVVLYTIITMKIPTSNHRRGFTLVELLVVISIFVVLAAAGFGAGLMAINKANKATALATASALQLAINNFYTDYGSLPNVNERVKTDSGDGTKLLEILLGLEPDYGSVQNTRGVKYLTAKETKTKSKGLLYNASGRSIEGLYDSWGSPFTVELNTQLENQLKFTVGSKPVTLNAVNCAVYSPGTDKKLGTADDVKTW
jgi:prepilin-type N-terminal cleavage/methylation domain-containing protein